jgi:hypothetical protein
MLVTALFLSSVGPGIAPAVASVLATPAQRGIVLAEAAGLSIPNTATDTVTVFNDNAFAVVISVGALTFTVTDLDDTIDPPTVTNNTCNAVLIFAQAKCTYDINIVANNPFTGDIEGGTVTIKNEISVRRLFGPFLDPVTVTIEVGILDVIPEPSTAFIVGPGLLAVALWRRTTIRQGSRFSIRFTGWAATLARASRG